MCNLCERLKDNPIDELGVAVAALEGLAELFNASPPVTYIENIDRVGLLVGELTDKLRVTYNATHKSYFELIKQAQVNDVDDLVRHCEAAGREEKTA